MLYMIYWGDPTNGYYGGHALVSLPNGEPKERAIDLGMSKASAMNPDAVFLKLEELSADTGVLWINEWYA